MSADKTPDQAQRGRLIAKVLAGTGVVYILVQLIAAQYQWPHRIMALFDLATLAIFGWALWMTWTLWRERQTDKGS